MNPPSKLSPCPASPNCVCSDDDGKASIEPFRFTCGPEQAWQALLKLVEDRPQFTIVESRFPYLHVEARTKFFRFVDDLEFIVRENGKIAIRSESRLGYWDLGTNRKRLEKLRGEFREGLG